MALYEITLTALMLSIIGTSSALPAFIKAPVVDLRNNATVLDGKICEDFYQYACHDFLDSTIAPANVEVVDQRTTAEQHVRRQLKSIMSQPITETDPKYVRNVKNFYASCMNTDNIYKGLLAQLDNLGGWPVLNGRRWNKANFTWNTATSTFKNFGLPTNYFIEARSLRFGTMIFPPPLRSSPDLYSSNSTKVRNLHNEMVATAVALGASKKGAAAEAWESLNFEINLSMIQAATQNLSVTTVGYLQNLMPKVSWTEYLNNILSPRVPLTVNSTIQILDLKYLLKFKKLIRQTPKRVQANYLMWNYVASKSKVLEYMAGVKKQPNSEYCHDQVTKMLPIAANTFYAQKYSNQSQVTTLKDIINNIISKLKETVQQIDWVIEENRQELVNDIGKYRFLVGYNESIFDDNYANNYYGNLELKDNFYENMVKICDIAGYTSVQNYVDVVRAALVGYATTVDLQFVDYSILYIPLGMLHSIFYDATCPLVLNYGSTGTEVAHKLFQVTREKINVVDQQMNELFGYSNPKFAQLRQCFVNNTDIDKENDVNGRSFFERVLEDAYGYKIAYAAFIDSPLEKQQTERKKFWINAARTRCTKYRSAHQVSPDVLRKLISNSFANIPEFSGDFECPTGSKMNPRIKCFN